MTIEQTVEIPESRRITLDLPPQVPAGKARITVNIIEFPHAASPEHKEARDEIPDWLKGIVSPALFRKGEILGDIIGPFHDEWENGY
jgi:hypothetical protein